jgi:photosynthetic reaction center cytochrome c subunit
MKRIATGWEAAAVMLLAVTLAGCERPPVDSTQNGYRGTAMGQITNPRVAGPVKAAQVAPAPVPDVPSPPGSPLAKDSFQNVKVLGDLPVGEFTRTMLAITAWVSPTEGCNYCHKPGEDLSSDSLYTKVVARQMLAMTRQINTGWKNHVAETGVTCYTCHRGQPVPAQIWFNQPGPKHAGGASALSDGHNAISMQAGLTAIDVNVLSRYLVGSEALRVGGPHALPENNPGTIKQTENIFGLMINMSESLGVNCTFCHNTRSHTQWSESPLQRTKAYHGIRMVRELNNKHVLPLAGTFPANRKGPTGDVAKVSCATCHQGVNKPLGGAVTAKGFPGLLAVAAPAAAPVAAAPATPAPATSVPVAATTPIAVAPAPAAAAATAAPAAAAATAVAAPTPSPVAAVTQLGSVFFVKGKDTIGADGAKAIAAAAEATKADPALKLSLSGFADKSGNANANLDLAKRRAQKVREALKTAGVDASRIKLEKPEFVIGADAAQSRRVDINPVR